MELYVPSLLAEPAPYNFPKGTKIGIVLHEIFEKSDFKKAGSFTNITELKNNAEIKRLISSCFEKFTITTGDEQTDSLAEYTAGLVWNTLKAKLPEITGTRQTEKAFSLCEIENDRRIEEAEFNMNPDESELLTKYCNGFVDLVFKREVNGKDIYSIVDWKSNSFERSDYANGTYLTNVTNEKYSIQRVLYSYCLVKWLSSFSAFENMSCDEIFKNHFGGIYYVYIRGCVEGTANGIYARTWKSWKDLEKAFKQIFENLDN